MTCPVCDSQNTIFYGTIGRFERPFSIRLCQNCQSSYQYPVPADHEDFYNSDYYSGSADYSYIDERKTDYYGQYVWKARIKNIKRFQKEGSFLDVGCSFGGLVRAAASCFDAFGVDISNYAVRHGNEFSHSQGVLPRFKGLFRGSLLDMPREILQAGPLNVITMIEVAEHLEQPALHIQKAFDLLKPGGLLVIQTANMSARQSLREGLNYHYYLPGHLTYFSRPGLKNLLEKTGFSSITEYFPVDFGILPKLLKMRGNMHRPTDYWKMCKAIQYHFMSYIKFNGIPLTSSYVAYAIK